MTPKLTIIANNLYRFTFFLRGCAFRQCPGKMFLLFCVLVLAGCGGPGVLSSNESDILEEPEQAESSLFDGETLGDWKITDFGGQGDVYVKDGAIYLEMGNYMTGINWAGPVVRMNYEITLEAKRVNGSDFFCGLTFPVADRPCSLILGGWGGSMCGLSNIDYYDAANNETTRVLSFKDDQWYRVRLRVRPDRIEAWVDDEELVNIETTGRHISVRPEMDMSVPLGIATWCTTGAIRNIYVRKLEQSEIGAD